MSFKYCKSLFFKGAVEFWNKRWERQADIPLARQTRLWFPKIRPDISTKIIMTKRRILSKYVLIFSGHNFYNRHQYLVTRKEWEQGKRSWADVQTPICNYCQTNTEIDPNYKEGEDGRPTQTTEHLFTECESFVWERLQIFGELYPKELHKIKLSQILAYVERTGINPLPEENSETQETNMLNIDDADEVI